MNKLLIDTNIFIYGLDKSSIHHTWANKILHSKDDLVTTSKNISEIFAVTSKLNVDIEIIFNYYQDIKRNVTIIFPSAKSLFRLEELIKIYKPIGNRVLIWK